MVYKCSYSFSLLDRKRGTKKELSWWPRPQHWAVLIGHKAWNEYIDQVVLKRERELNDLTQIPRPRGVTEWRQDIRTASIVRKVTAQSSINANSFLTLQIGSAL